jgi:hypothetical protein
VRGDLLPLWTPDGELDEETRDSWRTLAYRVALGVELVGHLEPIVDADRCYVGFCGHSAELAEMLKDAVLRENVGAGVAQAHPGMTQDDACDVILACRPDATDEEVNHAVLAAVKAAHAFFCAKPVAGQR